MKKFAAYDAPGRLFTIDRRMAKNKVGKNGSQCREPNRNEPPRSYDCTCPERCYHCRTKLQKNCLVHLVPCVRLTGFATQT